MNRIITRLFFATCALFISVASFSQVTIQIGTSTSVTGTTTPSPVNIYYRNSHHQILYTKAEINALGINGPQSLDLLEFNVTGLPTYALPNYTIKIKEYTGTTLTAYDPGPFTTIYNSASNMPTIGWNPYTFTTPFIWWDNSNLLIDICWDFVPNYTATGTVQYTTASNKMMYFWSDNVSACPTPTNFSIRERPNAKLRFTALPACTGTPTAGTASFIAGCPSMVQLSGNTIANMSFQWQKKGPCDPGWSDIPGASSVNYFIGSLAVATDFRAFVVCTNGSGSDTSNVVNVASITPCYCSLGAQYTAYNDISTVVVGSLTNNSSCNGVATGPGSASSLYNNYTYLNPPVLLKGSAVPFSVGIADCSSFPFYDNGTAIFIDYNQNGSFADPGERVFGNTAGVLGANVVSGTFTVPVTAATGITGMRIVNASNVSGSNAPSCGSFDYGETEDYLVYIMYAPDVTGEGVYCSGSNVTLTASAPGFNNPQFLWVKPDGSMVNSATLSFPNAQPTINGTYNAYVLDYPCGSLGAPDTLGPRIVNVWVNQTPPEPTVGSVLTYCQNAPFDSIYYYGFNLKWYDSATGVNYSTTAPVVNTGVTGSDTFYVSQTVNGCESPRKQVIINVVPAVSAPSVVSPVVYCEGDPAVALIANGQNILWYSVPSGGAGTPITPLPTTNAQGTFTWYASQTINGCESARAPVEVHVNYKPAGLVLAPREYVCQYDTMTLTYFGNADASAQYIWTFDVGNTVVNGSPTSQGPLLVRFDSAGVSRVKLQVNNGGCIGPQTFVDISVKLSPKVKIELQPDACKGETVTLAIGFSTIGIDHYTWNFAGGNIIYGSFSGGPYGIRWDNAGTKVLTVVANNDACKSLVEMDTIMIHDAPNAHIINVSKTDICTGDSVTIQAAAAEGNSYQWLPAEFFGESHDARQTGIVDFTTQIVVNVTSEFNCKASDSVLITTHPCCEIFMPNAFTPNQDGHNDKFHIVHQGNHELRNFRIQNRWGATVFETQDESAGWDGTYNNIPQDMGTYFFYVRYKCSDGQIYEKKGELLLMR
jgi:gliding motility-associated-like protein